MMTPRTVDGLPPSVRSMCLRAVVLPGTDENDFRVLLACGHSHGASGGTFGSLTVCPWCVGILFPEHRRAGDLPATW